MTAKSALVDALDAIAGGSTDADNLEQALLAYQETVPSASTGDVLWAYCELIETLVHAVRWLQAQWNAEPETSLHANAARIRASAVANRSHPTWPEPLTTATRHLAKLTDPSTPQVVAANLSRVPMPPRVTPLFKPPQQASGNRTGDDPPEEKPTLVIVIRFQGEPVMRPTALQPGAMHRFEAEVRIDPWPEDTDHLEVKFISVFPRDYLYASDLTFTKEELRQPLEIRIGGERPSSDPPLGLTASATLLRGDQRIPARIAGNTTLELVTFDPGTATPLNMPTTARAVQQRMSELANALPDLSREDKRDVRLLIEGVLRFGHTLLDERLDAEADIDEDWFQRNLSFFLRADPTIGARLEGHAMRAGGITDPLLGRIPLELKVDKKAISLEDAARRFVRQPTQYASAGDSQVSLLAVLDTSEKRAPAGVMGNEIKWEYPEIATGPHPPFPSMVGIIIIRAGFPRPSDFSR
ncbi:MAG: hypothetical protein OXM57_14400 [bacterium]|nr:hypothetical protein [bacterium]MDE0601380.1 hypothetical protein [bacterium]